MKDMIIEHEITDFDGIENLLLTSRLEVKNRQVCLRRADEAKSMGNGKFKVTHYWLRPGERPFDPLIWGPVFGSCPARLLLNSSNQTILIYFQ